MIASANFQERTFQELDLAPFEPGLRRIDEILAAVLAHYDLAHDEADRADVPGHGPAQIGDVWKSDDVWTPFRMNAIPR